MNDNQREETRKIDGKNSSVEFKPDNAGLAYHFRLRDYSSRGLGILVKKDSRILQFLKVGDVIDMQYYQGEDRPKPIPIKTKVQHISQPDEGKHAGHIIVGLYILD